MRSSSLRVTEHGPITRLSLAMKVVGLPLHVMSAYRLSDTLIDCGAPTTADLVVDWLRGSGVTRVIVTHHHEDHAGGGAQIVETLGLPVYAPEGAVHILASGPRMPLYRRVLTPEPRPFPALALGKSVQCDPYTLQVIATPGHAFDHVCFFEPEQGWLFTGDLFVSERVRILRVIENAWEHIRSLKKVHALEPRTIVCSQAGFVDDATEVLARKIAFWEGLAADAHELRRRGWSTRRISRRLLGHEGHWTLASLGDYSKRRLIESLLDEAPD